MRDSRMVGVSRSGGATLSSCNCAEREPAVPTRGATARIEGHGLSVRKFTKIHFSHTGVPSGEHRWDRMNTSHSLCAF